MQPSQNEGPITGPDGVLEFFSRQKPLPKGPLYQSSPKNVRLCAENTGFLIGARPCTLKSPPTHRWHHCFCSKLLCVFGLLWPGQWVSDLVVGPRLFDYLPIQPVDMVPGAPE